MFRHVLCVYPYRVEVGPSSGFWPPLGLEIVAAVLEPHAESIGVVDLRHEPGRTVDFLRPNTDLVCFSVNWERELDFVREEIRSVPGGILTIVGGRHASEDPEKWLSDCSNVDILVRGDGEEIIEEIVQGRPLDAITGISYRSKGEVVHGAVRHVGPVREDLWPNRRLRRYIYSPILRGFRTGLAVDSIASSRGCPFNCRFCSFDRNPWGTKRNWSARSPESAVREIEEIDGGLVIFLDDLFTHDMDRVEAVCDLIMARGIRKRYIVNARVEVAKGPNVLRKMERAGFSVLLLGIESAQDKSLRSMRKGFNTRQLREYFHVLRRTRMLLLGYFIVGNIGETEEEMLAIAPFARELGLDMIAVSLLRNERYSGLEELVAQTPGYHIAPDGKVFSDEYPVERLQQIRSTVYQSFHRPRQLLRTFMKVIRNGLITPGMIARLPWFLIREALGHRRRRKARLKRERSAAQVP